MTLSTRKLNALQEAKALDLIVRGSIPEKKPARPKGSLPGVPRGSYRRKYETALTFKKPGIYPSRA